MKLQNVKLNKNKKLTVFVLLGIILSIVLLILVCMLCTGNIPIISDIVNNMNQSTTSQQGENESDYNNGDSENNDQSTSSNNSSEKNNQNSNLNKPDRKEVPIPKNDFKFNEPEMRKEIWEP